jgi:hypothetical protein
MNISMNSPMSVSDWYRWLLCDYGMEGSLLSKHLSIAAGFYDILIMMMMIPVLSCKWNTSSVLHPLVGNTTDRGYCSSFCLRCVYCVKTLKSVSLTDHCDAPLQQALCKLAMIGGRGSWSECSALGEVLNAVHVGEDWETKADISNKLFFFG